MTGENPWSGLSAAIDAASRVEQVEIKVRVAPEHPSGVLRSFGAGTSQVEVRRVYFLDTPDLALDRRGVIMRIRTGDRGHADAVVKVRDTTLSGRLAPVGRHLDLDLEADVLPDRVYWSTSLKRRVRRGEVEVALSGPEAPATLFSREQHALLHGAAADIDLDRLDCFGPVVAVRRRVRRVPAVGAIWIETWICPDGSRIAEVSTNCSTERAIPVATNLSAILAEHSVELSDVQHTKAHSTVAFFAGAKPGPRGTGPAWDSQGFVSPLQRLC